MDIPDAPDPSLPCGRPDCFAMLPISHLSWILSVLSAVASLNLKTFLSNKTKGYLLNVQRASPGEHRRGTARGNAALQPSSPGPIQPVRSSRHAYRLDAKHAEALKPSILILITPPYFRFSSNFLVHARCVALVTRSDVILIFM